VNGVMVLFVQVMAARIRLYRTEGNHQGPGETFQTSLMGIASALAPA
jgi:hypothetical protein